MNEQNKKIRLLGESPVPKALMALGLPAMIGMMVNAMYNLADAYFVGGLGTSQAGAIAVAFPLGQAVVGLGLLFGNGAASYISRLLGKNEKETADKAASTAVYGSIATGAVMIIFVIAFLSPLLKLLGATESILPYAVTYTSIYVLSSIFNIFNVTMNNIVTSEGAAKTSMYALLSGAALNILLDPFFIYILGFGIKGAAIATAISQFVSTIIYLYYILSKKSNFSFHIKNCCFSKHMLSEIFKIGFPTLVFQLMTSLSIALQSGMAKKYGYGDSVIAGMGDVTRIISMGSLMVFGFIKGFQPIAGYSYGAGNYKRLREAVRISVIWTTLFCILAGLLFMLFPTSIISQFTADDLTLIEVGQEALRANGCSFLFFGYYTVYSSLFLALGKARKGGFLGVCRQGICYIPIILTAPMAFGLDGIIYAQPAADILSAVITVFMSYSLHKEWSEISKKIPDK